MAEPSRDGCTIIIEENSLCTRGYSLQKLGPDHFGTNHSCPVDAQGNNAVTLSGKTSMGLAVGRRPRDLLDPDSTNPEQLTSTPTKQDLLSEEIQQLALQTYLEVHQREDIRRDLSERIKFVPPDLRAKENVFYCQEDPSKIQQGRQSGKWLKVEIIAVKGSMAVVNTGATIISGNRKQAEETSGHFVDLEELPDSRERARAHVLWLSCEGQIDVWEMFSGNSYLSAILDRQGLQVAAPIDLRKKKAESFSPLLLRGFWHKLKKKNNKIVVLSPTVETKSFKEKEVAWQQHRLCMDVAEHQILGGKHFLTLGPGSGKIWCMTKVQYLQKKYHCQWTLLCGKKPKWIFHNLSNLLRPLELVPASRERVLPTEWRFQLKHLSIDDIR